MPPPNVRRDILRRVRNGDLAPASPLRDVPGIGRYLEGRLRRALNANAALTIGQFWAGFRRRSTAWVTKTLHRALQNERANQCVAPRRSRLSPQTYHAGDINEAGYQAAVALLDADRARGSAVLYMPLPPRLPPRSVGSRECGCRAQTQCQGACVWSDGACVPRSVRTRGFVGVSPHPDQGVVALTDTARRRVRNSARTRRTSPGVQRDPDSQRDLRAGHAATLRYSRRGQKLWRRPGSKVRLPVR